jgi:hypothetical protein
MLTIAMALAAAGGVAGAYDAQGSCPGQPAYHGTISLVGAGPVYAYTEVIGSDTFRGVAIERDGVIAVAFSSAKFNGVVNMRRAANGWEGLWSGMDGTAACRESWIRR